MREWAACIQVLQFEGGEEKLDILCEVASGIVGANKISFTPHTPATGQRVYRLLLLRLSGAWVTTHCVGAIESETRSNLTEPASPPLSGDQQVPDNICRIQ